MESSARPSGRLCRKQKVLLIEVRAGGAQSVGAASEKRLVLGRLLESGLWDQQRTLMSRGVGISRSP